MENKNIIDDDTRMQEMDARVEKYLRGQMDAHEEDEFINDMKTDTELADRAKAMAVLIKSIRKVGRRQDEAVIMDVMAQRKANSDPTENNNSEANHNDATTNTNESKNKARLIPFAARVVALAAMLLLLVGIGDFFIARYHTIGLANEYMAYAPQAQLDEGTFKGGELDATVMAKLTPVFREIEEGKNLQRNIETLSAMFAKAMQTEVNEYTDFADYIGYNLAIAHLKDNDRKMAQKVLKELLDLYPDYQMAKELLDKIDALGGVW